MTLELEPEEVLPRQPSNTKIRSSAINPTRRPITRTPPSLRPHSSSSSKTLNFEEEFTKLWEKEWAAVDTPYFDPDDDMKHSRLTKEAAVAIVKRLESEPFLMPDLPFFWYRAAGVHNFMISPPTVVERYKVWQVKLNCAWLRIMESKKNDQ